MKYIILGVSAVSLLMAPSCAREEKASSVSQSFRAEIGPLNASATGV